MNPWLQHTYNLCFDRREKNRGTRLQPRKEKEKGRNIWQTPPFYANLSFLVDWGTDPQAQTSFSKPCLAAVHDWYEWRNPIFALSENDTEENISKHVVRVQGDDLCTILWTPRKMLMDF